MDETSVTCTPASPTRAIVADEGFCRQAAAVLMCEPEPIRDAFVGEPVEEALEMVRWVLKHEGDPGFDAARASTRPGRCPTGPGSAGAARGGRTDGTGNAPTATGGLRVAGRKAEVHHAAPRCLVSLHEKANGLPLDGEGIQVWLEWEWEATRWRVSVEISRGELEALVDCSAVVLEREKHRLVHGEDWRRWGSRGGRETLRRYGADWFALLALKRWGRITASELDAARALR